MSDDLRNTFRHGMSPPRTFFLLVEDWWHCFCCGVMARDRRCGTAACARVATALHSLAGEATSTGMGPGMGATVVEREQ